MMLLLMGAMFMLSCSLMASSLMYATNFGVVPSTGSSAISSTSSTGTITQTAAESAAAASSATVQYDIPEGIKTDCLPGKRGIIGYEHEFRSGKSYMWCGHDNGRGSGIAYIGNDKLSYLSVPPGMKVTVYEHNDMGGLSKVFEKGEWDLHQHKFDLPPGVKPRNVVVKMRKSTNDRLYDNASSLKIEGVPVDASTPATSSSFWNMNR